MRKPVCLFLSLLMTLCLAGCGIKSGEELYALPQASAEYESLQECLKTILEEGMEYSAPLTGSNTQPVQLMDLDGDNRDEAIAFFRDSTTESQSLKIYIFREEEKHTYAPVLTIEGNGTAVNSLVTCQLEGGSESMCELLISWQLSTTVYSLSAYCLENYTLSEMLTGVTYTKYAVKDLNQDDNDEIVLFHLDSSDQSRNRAELYAVTDGVMTLRDTVSLSQRMGAIERLSDSTLQGGIPALFITGFVLDPDGEVNSSTVITDVLALRHRRLTNVSLDTASGNSITTIRSNLVSAQDINNDGVMEIPIPTPLDNLDKAAFPDRFFLLQWQQYRLNGGCRVICSTYHNTADGWYFTLPDQWVGHISLMRADVSTSMTVERSIVFYHLSEDGAEPTPFFIIYKNSGKDRQSRSEMDERFLLLSDPDNIYSAQFMDCDWDCGLDRASLAERFHLIRGDWLSS